MRLQWRAHRLVWDLSGGRLTNRVGGLPILELETTGHRSGAPRSILISYVDTPPAPVLAGSNAGADHDPAWVKNLRAAPRARVRQAGEWRDVRARFLEGEERQSVWELFLRHRAYSGYERMTNRIIPLVVPDDVG
jgi:deazaflavin-dependent oxidoreductase (nitroreductase family)